MRKLVSILLVILPTSGGAVAGATCDTKNISCGQTINGSLGSGSCQFGPDAYDVYQFHGSDGEVVKATLSSFSFQPELLLYDPTPAVRAHVQASPATVQFTLDGTGTWTWEVITPFQLVGNYTLAFTCPGASGACPANTLCIDQNPGDGRFQIQVSYNTTQGGGLSGSGNAIALSSLGVTEGGLFWFFGATNPEMLIKIIDGCSLGGHFWVFYAATTNVAFTVTVTDTVTGHQAIYRNPDKTAALPVQDTSALSCP